MAQYLFDKQIMPLSIVKFISTLSLFFMLACSCFQVQAQRRYLPPNNPYYENQRLHFGFLLGVGDLDFNVKMKPDYKSGDSLYGVEPVSKSGFAVGIVTNLSLAQYFDLRFVPVLTLGQRDLIYTEPIPGGLLKTTKTIETTYVSLPLEVKWKSKRLQNYRAYVVSGFMYNLDLASNAGKKSSDEDEYLVKLKSSDFLYTVGTGFDFYLPYYNKISLELKFSFGFLDLLEHDNSVYTKGIESLRARNVQIAITFE